MSMIVTVAVEESSGITMSGSEEDRMTEKLSMASRARSLMIGISNEAEVAPAENTTCELILK